MSISNPAILPEIPLVFRGLQSMLSLSVLKSFQAAKENNLETFRKKKKKSPSLGGVSNSM